MTLKNRRLLLKISMLVLTGGFLFLLHRLEEETTLGTHVLIILAMATLEQIFEFVYLPIESAALAKPRSLRKGLTGKTVSRIEEALTDAKKIQDNHFQIDHSDLAIWSYYEFWKTLEREQSSGTKELRVRALHSCQMNIWTDHPYAARILTTQERFVQAGGTIERILCGRGTPTEEVQKAAKSLLDKGIRVRYYDVSTQRVDHAFAWDFLKVDPSDDVVIWASPGSAGIIDRAIYQRDSKYRGKDLDGLWREVEAESEEMTVVGGEAVIDSPERRHAGPIRIQTPP